MNKTLILAAMLLVSQNSSAFDISTNPILKLPSIFGTEGVGINTNEGVVGTGVVLPNGSTVGIDTQNGVQGKIDTGIGAIIRTGGDVQLDPQQAINAIFGQ